MKKALLFLAAVLIGFGAMAQTNTYTKVTSPSELNAGDKVLLVGYHEDGTVWAMSYQKTNNRHAVEVTEDGGSITTSVAVSSSSQTEVYEITVGGQNGAWTFFDELNNGYLYAAGGGNYLKTQGTLDSKGEWTLTMDGDGFVPTSNGGVEQNIMRYNMNQQNNAPMFGCYKSSSNVTGLVYIYKAGGAPTIDPEPSEYPTGFVAMVDRTSVILTWGQSAGAQLPRGYVIIGSTGAINMPVDGTPIANDLNAYDGNVAYNVMFGTESFTFTQLPGNTTWTFAIFPFTNSGDNIDYKADSSYPSDNATMSDLYGVLYTDFANGLAPFTAYSVEGDQSWTTSVYDGIPFAKMSGYAGSAHANEDWLISPNLFANGSFENMTISFDNATQFDGPALQVLISNQYDGMSDPTEFEWADITDDFMWSQGNYEWTNSGEIYLEDIEATRVYLAFVYTSTDSEAATWEVTNVQINGTGYDAVAENEAVAFNLYPNPASSSINVVAENDCEIQIMDMAGRMVMVVNAVEGENAINVAELESGVYFVRMNGAVVKFVKR